ncbi:DNA primase [Actinorhabdospora filicis]|uniref:DNA primase n=1 Tax=Actinorhabdospora filicis TaxID=1785913 RepID=A0A9W6SM60_9ACTN|nr:DNA primase [Actinorhabdospora filicis]
MRERTAIEDVVAEHVTLKPAGSGNLKGLCPFHDEKTPSFHVTPSRGFFYCYGCGVGGDAISFLMRVDHLSFAESMERLAGKAGYQLRYEDAGGAHIMRPKVGVKQRLIAAHAEAALFYQEQLARPEAQIAREFLSERGFDRSAAETYGCGFAPDAWDVLTKHLQQKGFTANELTEAGLAKPARSGRLIDRFRRRLIWPITDLTGDVIGFGARRLFADDDGPKYLNTPETPLYKKSQVLYGINHAKKEIAKQGRAVIVEGYTDVMACHLAGVPTAVATCGTAFGGEHISVLRRMLMDSDEFAGEIVFTFDGDAAGQKAALRAFEDDQKFVAQTFIAVAADGMDPCDLRLARGDDAVRELVAAREPLIAFALRSVLARYDLDTVEGQVAGLRATAPMIAKIKDRSLIPGYINHLAGRIGIDVEQVRRAVASASGQRVEPPRRAPVASPDNPRWIVEREALKLAIQSPAIAGPYFDIVDETPYGHPLHAEVRKAIAAAGGASVASAGPVWISSITDSCADLGAQALVGELAVEPLRVHGEADYTYAAKTLARVQIPAVNERVESLKSRLQRVNPVEEKDEYMRLFGELISLEQHARSLREQASQAV